MVAPVVLNGSHPGENRQHKRGASPESHDVVSPEPYERWRRSTVGSITEAREREVVFDLVGPLEGLRLLDVGCGDGAFLVEAARKGAVVTGVDASEAMLTVARRRIADHGVTADLHQGDAQELPFDDAAFDVVVAVTILCFLHEPQHAVAEMSRVLRPGGRLVIGELGRWNTWAAWRRIRGWLGSPTWRHTTFRTARQLIQLISHAGLQPEQVQGAVYYPPSGLLARLLKRLDPVAGSIATTGAAFIAVAAAQPPR